MQIDKNNLLQKFESFIRSISNSTEKTTLLSFSFKIPEIQINYLINSKLRIKQDYFYWKISNEKLEFLAIDSLVNFEETGEQRLKKTGEKINSIASNFRTNWDENEISTFPMVVGGIKFSPNQKSNLWNNFSDSDWFIPKYLFYSKENKTYLI